jgi:hypothetical protein
METPPNRLPKDHPMYEARLRAQHGLVLGLGALPGGIVGGLLLGVPLAQQIEGFPLSILTTGVLSVLVFLALGLLVLAAAQGLLRLVRGFWTLEHAMEEISEEKRIAWYTAIVGLFFLGLALGYSLALVMA